MTTPIEQLARQVLDGKHSWLEDGIVDLSEGTGPWIAEWQPGESKTDNKSRRYR